MPADHQPRNTNVADWLDTHRVLAGSVLLLLLGIGLSGFWPFIRDEWPRLDDFHRAAIWIADATAVALVIKWMFLEREDSLAFPIPEQNELDDRRRRLRWISLSLLLSLMADIGVTVHGIYADKLASARSVQTDATVVGLTSISWQPVTHYKLRIRFDDANGKEHAGLLVFTEMSNGLPAWVDPRTRQAIANGLQRFPIRIRYDPLQPARVWNVAEPWNRGHALGYGFAVIHLFQLIALGAPSVAVWFVRDLRPSAVAVRLMPMLALAVESCALAIWGLLFRFRGF